MSGSLPPRVTAYVMEAAREHSVAAEEVLGRSRRKRVKEARHQVMRRLYADEWTISAIGRALGLHHTTVLHAVGPGRAPRVSPDRACGCGKPIRADNGSGRCRTCQRAHNVALSAEVRAERKAARLAAEAQRRAEREAAALARRAAVPGRWCGCGAPIWQGNTSGQCRACYVAAMRGGRTAEEHRAHLNAKRRERRERRARRKAELAAAPSPDGVPAERRAEYRRLVRGGFPSAEAVRIILDDVAVQARRAAAKAPPPPAPKVVPRPTGLAHQLERLRQGARLVERVDLRRPDPDVTLGGVSAGLL